MRGMLSAWRAYRKAFGQDVAARLADFFLFLDPSRLWVANLLVCAGLGLVALLLTRSVALSVGVAVLALAAPRYLVALARRRRLRAFEIQLPDLLMSLAAALRAGAALQPALRDIVSQSPAPLAQEFALILRQQRMGVSWEAALLGLRQRMPTEGSNLVVSALVIASRSGGAIAQTLDGVAQTLRERIHMAARIQALTSQGRLQAWLMACMPFALALALYMLDSDAMRPLWETPGGWVMVGFILLLMTAGMLLIRRIVDIEI
ncbi:pilus assembly protein [Allopusillimonas ginsengisoli]|nr:pilus assembly protein [Allopusillimonas ginsengisoli]